MGSYGWNGGSGGWGTIANWTGGIPNGTTADATIAAAGTYTVTIEAAQTYTVDSVTLSDGTAILDVLGTLDLGGTLALMDIAAGTLELTGLVSGGTIDINNGATLQAAGGTVSKTTTLNEGGSGYFNLSGSTITLAGTSSLMGYNLGPGEVVLSGVATFSDNVYFEAGTTLDDTGTISLASGMQWANADSSTLATVLTIAAGGVFDFTAANSGWGLNGTLNGTNAGLLESTSGGYYNAYFSNFINTGTISMSSGSDISLLGGQDTIGGLITGAGDFYLGQGVTASLVSGLVANSGVFTVSDGNTEVILEANESIGGSFVEQNGAYIDLNAKNLTLTGTGTLNAYIGGGGTVVVAGTLDSDFYLGSGSEELVTGTAIDAFGNNRLDYDNGTAASILSIATTGTYDITAVDSQIDYSGAIGTVINAGLFEVTEPGTTGSYFNLYEEFTQASTGTIYLAADDDLSLTRGPDLLAGTIEGPGEIGVYQGSTVTLAAGLVLNAGGFTAGDSGTTVILESSRAIAGIFIAESATLIDLNGNNLTLSGSGTLDNFLNGPGTLFVTGTFDNTGLYLQSGVTEVISGVEYQTDEMRLDYDGGTVASEISITSGGTYDIVSDSTIDDYSGYDNYGTITNAGLFEKTGNTTSTNVYAAFTNASTGTIVLGTGLDISFLNNQTNNISGLITGDGYLYFGGNGGPELIQAGATFGNLAQITVSDSNTQFILESSRTIAASTVFRDQNSGDVLLNGNTLTLGDGQFYNAYLQGNGALVITGDADFNGLNVIGTVTILDKGTITQSGYNELGTNGSANVTLSISSGAVYDILNDTYINPQGGPSAIVNAGLFEKTAGTGISDIYAPINNTGTILAALGILRLDNGGTLGGTLEGAGEIELNGGTVSLSPSAVISVSEFIVTGADLVLEHNVSFTSLFVLENGGTINLGGYTLSLNNQGDVLGGNYIFGPGTVSESGRADINSLNLSGGVVLSDLGTITQDGGFNLGINGTDAATLTIASGAIYDMVNDNNIGTNGAPGAVINNAGLFEKTADNGGLNIYAGFNNAAGATLNVAYGYIQLDGGGTLAGMITGAGTLYLNQYYVAETYTLAAGAVVNVGTFDLNGATLQLVSSFTLSDTFVEGGGDLNITGYTLTISGNDTLVNSYLSGLGTLNVTGTAELHNYNLTGNVTLLDSGTINADGVLYLGFNASDSGTLSIASGGVYDFINSSADVYLDGNGTVINAGLIEKTADNGLSQINAAINNTGIIDALRGTIDLSGGGILGGTLEGGTIELGGGTFTLGTAAVVSVATFDDYNATLDILNNRTFAGNFNQYYGGSTLALGGHNVTLSGTASLGGGAEAAGAGTVVVTGTADINGYNLTGGAELLDSGTITEDGNLQMGQNSTDTATLSIASGAVYNILNDSNVYAAGTVTIQNAGLFEKTGSGTGRSYTQGAFTNTGTIIVSSGILEEQSLVNSGTVIISNAFDQTDTNVAAAAGKSGVFALTGSASLNELGGIAASETISLTGTSNLIDINNASVFFGTITGFTAGDTIDLQNTVANGDAYAGGVLTLKENGTVVADITLSGIANVGSIVLVSDGGNGTDIEFNNPGSITQPNGSVVTDNWTVASGNFNAAADWSNGVPGTLGAAAFAGSLGTITVTDNTSNTIYSLNDQDGTATFSQTTGTLTMIDGGTWNGLVLQTGGEMLVESGILNLQGNATIAGTLAGAGGFYLGGNGDAVTLASTAVLSAATIDEGYGATLAIESNLAYAGSFSSGNYGTLELDGFNLSLTGAANLTYGAHVAGPGILTVKGPTALDNYQVQQGAQLVIAAAATQLSNLDIGNSSTDTSAVTITSTGTLNITADSNVNGNGAASLLDSGLLETTGDFGNSYIEYTNVTETSAGIIDVTRGTLNLYSANDSLAGTIEGAGTLYLQFDNVTLASTAKLNVATLAMSGSNVTLSTNETFGGNLDLIGGAGGTLELGGFVFDQTGASELGGVYIGGTGTLEINAAAEMQGAQLVNNAELLDNNTIIQDGGFALGYYGTDSTSLVIAKGAVYDIENGNGIGASGTATIFNNGLFEKTADFGNSYIAPVFDNGVTGTLDVAEGTLFLQDGGTLGGTIEGAGNLYLQNSSGTITVAAGAVLTVATFNANDQMVLAGSEVYAGDFILTNNLNLNGNNLTLTGPASLDSSVQGNGTLNVVSGDINGLYLYQGAVMNITGTVTQDGGFTMSNNGTDSTVLNIAKGAVFDILTDNGIGNNGTAVINNSGLFERTGDYGGSTIQDSFTNSSTGTINAQRGDLYFDNGGSFAGTLTGAVDGNVPQGAIAVNGGVFSLASTAVVSVAGLELLNGTLALGGNLNYAGSFSGTGGALDLDGHNITLASPNLGGFILTGPGTMDVTGTGTLGNGISGGAVLVDQGTLFYQGLQLGYNGGDSGVVSIAAGGVFDIIDDNYIGANGTVSIVNAGLFEKTADYGYMQSNAAFTNQSTGTIDAVYGTIGFAGGGVLGGTLEGAGEIYLNGNNTLTSTVVTVGTLNIESQTTLAANLTYGGDFILGYNNGMAIGGEHLDLTGTADLVGGFSGAGTVTVAGFATVQVADLYGGATLLDTGTIIQIDELRFSLNDESSDTLAIAGTGIYDIQDDSNFHNFNNGSNSEIVTNAGLLEKTGNSGLSDLQVTMTNTGTVLVDSGTLQVDAVSNLAGGTLSGGTWAAVAGLLGPTLALEGGTIAVDAAAITLSGAGSAFLAGGVALEASLTSITAAGILDLAGGRGFAAANAITDAGKIILAGGTLSAPALTLAGGATLSGSGFVAGPVTNNGLIDSLGTLDLTSSLSGTGSVLIGAGDELILGAGIAAGEKITFGGSLDVLSLGAPSAMLGTLVSLAPSDTIDYLGTSLKSATISGTHLIVTLTAGGTISTALANANAHDRAVISSDGHGGTDVTIFGEAAASAITPTPVNFGQAHAGAALTETYTISNTSSFGLYGENLDASMGAHSGSVTDSGSFTGLGDGQTNSSALHATLVTTTGGVVSGTATVNLYTDGKNVTGDGSGTVAIGTESVSLAGTIFNYATATTGTTNLGEAHAGGTTSGFITISNGAVANGYSENLDASFSGTSLGLFGSGSVSELGAGGTNSNGLAVSLTSATGGVVTGKATLGVISDGSTIDTLGTTTLANDTVAVTGTYFAFATASTIAPVSLGQGHVGGTLSKYIVISNTAAANGYSENLDATFSGTSANLSGSNGSISELGAGATSSNGLDLVLGAGTAGTVSGSATLGLISDGSTIDTLGTTTLASQTVAVSGTLFNYATASTVAPINFGIVHVGQSISQSITLSNTAAAGKYSENLDTSFSGTTGSFTTSGSVSELKAGAKSTSLAVTLQTGAAGTLTGATTLGVISDGKGIDTLGTTTLAGETIALTGTVNNYATATVEAISGPGTLSLSGTTITLNFGTVTKGAAGEKENLGILNSAVGPADLLSGSFSTSGTTGFTNSGLGTFSNEAAGSADTKPIITLSTGTAGTFSETIVINTTGSNASGYKGALTPETLVVTGTVAAAVTTADTAADTVSVPASPAAMNFVAPAPVSAPVSHVADLTPQTGSAVSAVMAPLHETGMFGFTHVGFWQDRVPAPAQSAVHGMTLQTSSGILASVLPRPEHGWFFRE